MSMIDRIEYRLMTERAGELDNFRRFFSELLSREFSESERNDLSVLDVACGYMKEAPVLLECFKAPISALDVGAGKISHLREKWGHEKIRTVLADAGKLKKIYRKKLFDLILMRHPDILSGQGALYKPCKEVLKPTGRMLSTFHMSDEMELALADMEKAGYQILSQGQNPHGTWDLGIQGFCGQDGYYAVGTIPPTIS